MVENDHVASELPSDVIGVYDISKDKELYLARSPSGTSLYIFKFKGGGELPAALKGSFTGKNTADIAVNVYLEKLSSKPESTKPKTVKDSLKK
jgi:hypothetical protein